MSKMPNLYMKWRLFKDLFDQPKSDAEIAAFVIGGNDPEQKFTRMLYGDRAMSQENADALCEYMNQRLGVFRLAKGLGNEGATLSTLDLDRSSNEFAQRLLALTPKAPPEGCLRAHQGLIDAILGREGKTATLTVERFGGDKIFINRFRRGQNPVVFRFGEHGRIILDDLKRQAVRAYLFLVHDPAPRHVWDQPWGDTVMWAPSPFAPASSERRTVIMDTAEVDKVAGRFIVTAVVLFDDKLIKELDPRKNEAIGELDEQQTARFLTNLRRLEKSGSQDFVIATAEYQVLPP